jgi:hypothetical protein
VVLGIIGWYLDLFPEARRNPVGERPAVTPPMLRVPAKRPAIHRDPMLVVMAQVPGLAGGN